MALYTSPLCIHALVLVYESTQHALMQIIDDGTLYIVVLGLHKK